MNALKAVGVCRKYGTQPVLNDFNLTLEPGSFEALMGPSGSGKSTFLHLAAGLLVVDAGEIFVGERNIAALSDGAATKFRRSHIGFVYQAFNLLNEMTVRENILMPVRLGRAWGGGDGVAALPSLNGDSSDGGRACRSATAAERLATLADKLGLAALLGKKPEELSGGEQQRVAIARALIAEPEIVLADEPTGNLDAQAAKRICALLKDLNETEKSAILVVTHDPVVAACAKKVHFLKEGRIAASYETQGDPARVSELYLDTYR